MYKSLTAVGILGHLLAVGLVCDATFAAGLNKSGHCLWDLALTDTGDTSPVERLQGVADSMVELRKTADPLTYGNMELARVKNSLLKMRRFFVTVQDRSLRMTELSEQKIAAIDKLAARLPEDIMKLDVALDPPLRSPTDAQLASLKWRGLVKLFQEFQQNEIDFHGFLKLFRELSNNVLSSTEVQMALRDVVVDGLEFLVQQAVLNTGDPLGRDNGNFTLYSLLTRDELSHFGRGGSNLDLKGSTFFEVNVSPILLQSMLAELISNGSEASQRRHPQENISVDHSFNWDLALAHVRLRRDAEGNGLIEIEDFGNPKEFTVTTGLGNSGRQGVGIGRYRAQWLAKFMGLKISYQVKPDGSGSLVTVIFPKAVVVDPP